MPKGTPGKVIIVCLDCDERKEHYAKGRCKLCYWREYYQERREEKIQIQREWGAKNRERHRAYNRRYRQEHPEEKKLYARRYYQDHREEELTRSYRWAKQNPEKVNAITRRWRKKNPEKMRIYAGRHRARKNAVANTLTPEQTEFERKIGEATYPGKKLHLHHIVPFSKGGGHTWGNIAFIPVSLNTSIKGRLPEEVYVQVGLGI